MSQVKVRLLFADCGEFVDEVISVPAKSLDEHDRLIDALREDLAVLKKYHIDLERLVSAALIEDAEIGA